MAQTPQKSAKERLTIKQQDFCLEYVRNRGRTSKAYLTAFPSSRKWTKEAVSTEAFRLLDNPDVSLYIASIRSEAENRSKISTDRVLREELCLSFADPGELYNEDGMFKPIPDLPAHVRRAISSFKATEIWGLQRKCPHCDKLAHVGPKGGVRSVRLYRYEYKFWDKGKSLERISKHLGLYEKDNQQKALALLQIILAVLPAAVADRIQAIAEEKLVKMGQMPALEQLPAPDTINP